MDLPMDSEDLFNDPPEAWPEQNWGHQYPSNYNSTQHLQGTIPQRNVSPQNTFEDTFIQPQHKTPSVVPFSNFSPIPQPNFSKKPVCPMTNQPYLDFQSTPSFPPTSTAMIGSESSKAPDSSKRSIKKRKQGHPTSSPARFPQGLPAYAKSRLLVSITVQAISEELDTDPGTGSNVKARLPGNLDQVPNMLLATASNNGNLVVYHFRIRMRIQSLLKMKVCGVQISCGASSAHFLGLEASSTLHSEGTEIIISVKSQSVQYECCPNNESQLLQRCDGAKNDVNIFLSLKRLLSVHFLDEYGTKFKCTKEILVLAKSAFHSTLKIYRTAGPEQTKLIELLSSKHFGQDMSFRSDSRVIQSHDGSTFLAKRDDNYVEFQPKSLAQHQTWTFEPIGVNRFLIRSFDGRFLSMNQIVDSGTPTFTLSVIDSEFPTAYWNVESNGASEFIIHSIANGFELRSVGGHKTFHIGCAGQPAPQPDDYLFMPLVPKGEAILSGSPDNAYNEIFIKFGLATDITKHNWNIIAEHFGYNASHSITPDAKSKMVRLFDNNHFIQNVQSTCTSNYFGGFVGAQTMEDLMQKKMVNSKGHPSETYERGCVTFTIWERTPSDFYFYLFESPVWDERKLAWVTMKDRQQVPGDLFPVTIRRLKLIDNRLHLVSNVAGSISIDEVTQAWKGLKAFDSSVQRKYWDDLQLSRYDEILFAG